VLCNDALFGRRRRTSTHATSSTLKRDSPTPRPPRKPRAIRNCLRLPHSCLAWGARTNAPRSNGLPHTGLGCAQHGSVCRGGSRRRKRSRVLLGTQGLAVLGYSAEISRVRCGGLVRVAGAGSGGEADDQVEKGEKGHQPHPAHTQEKGAHRDRSNDRRARGRCEDGGEFVLCRAVYCCTLLAWQCALGLWLLRLLCSLRPYGPVLCTLCPASVVYIDVRYASMDRRMRSAARAHAHTHTHTNRTTGSAFRKLS
jgi:hypothetical protein